MPIETAMWARDFPDKSSRAASSRMVATIRNQSARDNVASCTNESSAASDVVKGWQCSRASVRAALARECFRCPGSRQRLTRRLAWPQPSAIALQSWIRDPEFHPHVFLVVFPVVFCAYRLLPTAHADLVAPGDAALQPGHLLLAEKTRGTSLASRVAKLEIVVLRYDQDAGVLKLRLDAPRRGEAIHTQHDDVHERPIRALDREGGDRFLAACALSTNFAW
jgi:hypothetical protein